MKRIWFWDWLLYRLFYWRWGKILRDRPAMAFGISKHMMNYVIENIRGEDIETFEKAWNLAINQKKGTP